MSICDCFELGLPVGVLQMGSHAAFPRRLLESPLGTRGAKRALFVVVRGSTVCIPPGRLSPVLV